AAGRDDALQAAAEARAADIHRELWSEVDASVAAAPTTPVATLGEVVNAVIDLDATRLHALREHVPPAVWLVGLLGPRLGSFVCGYYGGASGGRSAMTHLLLPLLVALVVSLTADLDESREGLIGISQQPLLDLKASISASAH